jgi:hypothetical protein
MTEHDFEQQLARRLHADAEHGVRPYDAVEVARAAMWSGGPQPLAKSRRRSGPPAWFRSMVLAGLLVVLLVAAAFVGGLIRLPNVNVLPTASPTTAAEVSPTPIVAPSLVPTLVPTKLPSPDPSASPGSSPDASPAPSPSPDVSPIISPEPSPTLSPSPEPSPEPSSTASPTPATGWREIEGFPAGRRTSLNDIAHGRAGFVIVGGAQGSGRAWFSPDGFSWTRAGDATFGNVAPTKVVTMGGQFYAFGPALGGTRVWRSANGRSWTPLSSSIDLLEQVNDVTVANGVMIAVGSDFEFNAARIWTSEDGESWFAIGAPDGPSELTAVAARGGDIAVIADGGFEGGGRRLYFRPTHTGEWQRIDVFGEDQDGRLLDLVTNGNRFVAVGYEDNSASGRRQAVVRSTVDGSSWARTVVADRSPLAFDQVVTLPDGRFLAVASEHFFSVGDCRPRACVFVDEQGLTYVSANGTDWTPAAQVYERFEDAPQEGGDEVGHPRGVAAGPQGVVIVDGWFDGPHVFFAPADTYR